MRWWATSSASSHRPGPSAATSRTTGRLAGAEPVRSRGNQMSTSEKARPSRRNALLGDRPGSYAIARGVRVSPQKARRVIDLVRGLDVNDALVALQFAPQAASEPVYKV